MHCSSLVACKVRALRDLSRTVVPYRSHAAFGCTCVARHPEVCRDEMFSVVTQGQHTSIAIKGSLSQPKPISPSLIRVATWSYLSRRGANNSLSQQRSPCRDREVPITTQTSLPAWEPYRDIRFLLRHNRPLQPKDHVAT